MGTFIQNAPKFVTEGPIDIMPVLVQVMVVPIRRQDITCTNVD